MFGLVLSIGIVIDDAIVVVENVERHMRAGTARASEAAHVTMDEVGGALIGIAPVLVAVFVPTAFMGGIAGQFYKQFALTIASATMISLARFVEPDAGAVCDHPQAAFRRATSARGLATLGARAAQAFDTFSERYGVARPAHHPRRAR